MDELEQRVADLEHRVTVLKASKTRGSAWSASIALLSFVTGAAVTIAVIQFFGNETKSTFTNIASNMKAS